VDAFDGVAGGAHLAVDVEAAAEGCAVVGGHEAGVVPGEVEGVDDVIGEEGYGGGGGECGGCCCGGFVAVLAELLCFDFFVRIMWKVGVFVFVCVCRWCFCAITK